MKTIQFSARLASLVILVMLLGACATGPKFQALAQPPSNMGDVYVYRVAAVYAFGQSFDVFIDGKKAGELPNASYLQLRLNPGRHTLQIAPGGIAQKSEYQFEVQGGSLSFYQYDFNSGPLANYLFIGSAIQSRSQAKALQDMKELSQGRRV